MRGSDRGQSLVEFLLLCAVLAFALLIPVAGGESAAGMLLRALLHSLRARSFLVSIL